MVNFLDLPPAPLRHRRPNEPLVAFVYGTLQDTVHFFCAGATVLDAAAVLAGHTLYDVGRFPAMVASGQPGHEVLGQLWQLPAEYPKSHLDRDQWSAMDGLEGVPFVYDRVLVSVYSPALAGLVAAQTYVWQRPTWNLAHIGREWRPAAGEPPIRRTIASTRTHTIPTEEG